MFDIAFTELLVIGVVALLVIGPERLPKVARTAGQWLGKLNRYVSQVKQDIDRDMKLEELRKLQQEMKETAQKYEILAQETGREIEQEVGQVEKVVAAMAATDGGLSRKAYDEIKAEEAARPQAHEKGAEGDKALPEPSPAAPALSGNLDEAILPDDLSPPKAATPATAGTAGSEKRDQAA
jgi:sec-independent protein translocase protein TatB